MVTFNQNVLKQVASAIGATKSEVSAALGKSDSMQLALQEGCGVYCHAKVFDNGKHGNKGECTLEIPSGIKFKIHKNGSGIEIQKTYSPFTLKKPALKKPLNLAGKGAVPQFLAFGKK
ncbi:hypothetical protein COU37_04085 [Candidatus Micrarchaeota archaeon CG10_big_fil_rev_8_21_14_0_10_45_29]|nr:MAG: hypothetical protein COU37_04085 [Candidatus Micrarchaeota archaeon CG10_big_fil_rev_8_21_14_0_10_45_29]